MLPEPKIKPRFEHIKALDPDELIVAHQSTNTPNSRWNYFCNLCIAFVCGGIIFNLGG